MTRLSLESSAIHHLRSGRTSARKSLVNDERREKRKPDFVSSENHRGLEKFLCTKAKSPFVTPHPCHGSHPSPPKVTKRSKRAFCSDQPPFNENLTKPKKPRRYATIPHIPMSSIWPEWSLKATNLEKTYGF